VLLLVILAISAITLNPLAAFNALVPKDPGSHRVAEAVAYGDLARQRLDVYAPRDRAPGGPLPAIVFFYGGGWSSGERGRYAFAARALAARGFVVVVPDYRLVPEVRFPDFLRDGAAAVGWTKRDVARFGGDPECLIVVGHSAGAYNAAMLALDPRWLGADRARVRALITLAGPFDFLPLDDEATTAAFGGWPTPEDTQPIHHAGAAPPALLLHGAEDRRVRPRNSRRLAARLVAAGSEARLKIYPGIGHVSILTALARPFRHRAPVLDDIAAFARQATAQAGCPG
jgi:acetyl esterase/lipase